MTTARFTGINPLKKQGYKTIYTARAGTRNVVLHEYPDEKIADYEARVSRHLSCDQVDRFVEEFKRAGKTCLVQEAIDGESPVRHFSVPRPLAEKITFATSVLAVLQKVHQKGVIYNNLSPEDMTLRPDGSLVFHNLISARLLDANPPPVLAAVPRPHYMAPERTEQVESGTSGFSSDYYAFGVLLYWLFTGERPFEAEDLSRLTLLHVARQPRYPSDVNPGLPERLSQIIEKLLEKAPARRYQSIEGILYDLNHYRDPGFQPATRDMVQTFKVSKKIYNREQETGQLEHALQNLAPEQTNGVVISGYSGVGKSTVMLEFQKSSPDTWCRIISGKFQQYKKDIPYFAIVEAFDDFFDLLLLSDQAVLDDFRNTFTCTIGDQGGILTAIFPKLGLIVGDQPPVDSLVGEEAENRFNYVFSKFLSIAATPDRPLVLFLDDMQWTDLVSLNVLRAVFQNAIGYLLVVLCYRANEVDAHHPFWHFLEHLKRQDLPLKEIIVKDLGRNDVSRLIKDSLGYTDHKFCNLVYEKTHGNAFFVHQLLKDMADQGCFHRDVPGKTWTVDMEKAEALKISSNVVDLMQKRLKRLPPLVIELLKIIGAVGHNASLDILSIVAKMDRDAIVKLLEQPFEYGLLTQKHAHVYFTHDKIQQACYQLNPDRDLPGRHFSIAKALMAHGRCHTHEDLFSLAGHLDKGFNFIREEGEAPYVEIYMKAALKSKTLSAYNEFLAYVGQALALLSPRVPEALRFQVYREYHIGLYLNSRFDAADAFFNDKLAGYDDILTLGENYFSKVSQDSMRKDFKGAVEFGMSVLEKTGIRLKKDPGMQDLRQALAEVEALFDQAGITEISQLSLVPKKDIAKMTFVSDLLLAMMSPAFFYNPLLACLLVFTTLKLAVRNGVYEGMADAFATASAAFILVQNDYRAGYAYARFSMQVAAGSKRALGNSKHLFILFSWHWSNPIKTEASLEILRDAHHLLVQGGDLQMAGLTYCNTVTYLWERGEELSLILAEAEKGLAFNEKTRNHHGKAILTTFYQVARVLTSRDDDVLTLSHGPFNEEAFFRRNEHNPMATCVLYIYKTQLAYMFGAYDKAHAFGLKARQLLPAIIGFPPVQSGIFYGALSACAVLNPADEGWAGIVADLHRMKDWARGAEENYTHKCHLLEAEIARKEKNEAEAIRSYVEALLASKQSQFHQDTALVYERFASFWQEQGNSELGEYYVKRAFQQYELWGATRKCQQLQDRYQQVYLESTVKSPDLLSVINAQNVLARETDIKTLLKQMMQILLEVSGAEKGVLILKQEAWSIEALKTIQGKESYLQGLPLGRELLSVDMVNYVIRTGRIADIAQFSGRLEDIYLKHNTPRSLIALPAVVSSQTIAVIYLEHARIKDMFTPKKQEMIKLLSTQIAISLHNAKIYNQLENRVRERTRELAARNEALTLARKKADAANEAKSEFLNHMSHELRTPLNAVTGFSELLTTLVSDPRQKRYLEAIKTAGKNLLTLINDVLDLSKIEAGKIELAPGPVRLASIFSEIRQIFTLTCREKGLDLFIIHCPDLPEWLYLDEKRIRQILLNLVGNAVKFTHHGQIELSAHHLPEADNTAGVKICVRDTGIGIPVQEQEKIFNAFEQQKRQKDGQYGGTGLGLAITRRIVTLMGGNIFVTSSPQKGSLFTVELRRVRIASPETLPLTQGPLTLEGITFSPARILVADDIGSNRLLLKESLARVNLEVMTAANGQDAIILAKKHRPHLIIMDIRMPGLSGFDAAKTLKNNRETAHIPILALTASPRAKDKEIALASGFDGFLSKPVHFDRLLSELSRHLAHETANPFQSESFSPPDSLPAAAARKPETLCRKLKTEVRPCIHGLEKAFTAGGFKDLATRLDRIGQAENIQALSGCASQMKAHLAAFDIKKMTACLTVYGKMIDTFITDLEKRS